MKKSYTIKSYFKKHWWLFLILFLLPLVLITIFCIIFKFRVNDVGAWASLISGLFTYIGTIFLTAFIYYVSWKQNVIEFNNNLPDVEIKGNAKYLKEKQIFTLFDYNDIKDNLKTATYPTEIEDIIEDLVFYEIKIKNTSKKRIKDVSACYYLTIKDGKYFKNYKYFLGLNLDEDSFPIDYKENVSLYFGIKRDEIKELNNNKKLLILRFVYYIDYQESGKSYLISDVILGSTMQKRASFVNDPIILDKNKSFPYKVSGYYKSLLK